MVELIAEKSVQHHITLFSVFCFYHSILCFLSYEQGCPDSIGARQPGQTTTRFRLESKVQSVGGGFLFSKTDIGRSRGGFASPKPEQPEPDRSYKKIWLNPAKTSQIWRDLDQIQRDLNQICLYLVVFSQIQPNPTISSEKMHISEKIQFSVRIFQFPAKFSRFLQEFPVFGKNSRFQRRFFQISMPFLIPATDLTRSMLTITENRTDRFFQRLVSGYSAPPLDAGELSPGWVENRPGSTREQPQL